MLGKIQSWMKLLLFERTVLVLILLFGLAMTLMLWHEDRWQSKLIESMALTSADLYSQAIAEFRTLYTQEVVDRVRRHGIQVIHNYQEQEGTIPLPATLSMELGKRIGAHQQGAETRLYSAYPFPWRKEQGGLQDEFAKEAWEFLKRNPDQPYYEFAVVNGRASLRFATADVMRSACVDCHNTYSGTPKADWKVGDVRGVLEIIYPMDSVVRTSEAGVKSTVSVLGILALLWLGGLGLVISRLRRDSLRLEHVVDQRTAQVRRTNQELEKEILERKQAVADLQKGEQKFRILSESLPMGLFEIGDNGECLFSNYACQEILQRPLQGILQTHWLSWFHEDDRANLEQEWDVCKTNLEMMGRDCRLHRADGHDVWVRLRFSPIATDLGVRYVGTVEDTTEVKLAEEQLRKAHVENEEILASISAILIRIDEQGVVTQWNDVAEATFGIAKELVLGLPPELCPLTWEFEEVLEAINTCRTTRSPVHLENVRFFRSDGTDGFLGLTLNPITSTSSPGEYRGCLLLGRDITERQMMERQLAQAQRLESIGQLAAGVAHEINTPIQFVGDNTRFLQEAFHELYNLLDRCAQLAEAAADPQGAEALLREIGTAAQEADLAYLTEEIPKAISQSLEGVERVASIVQAMKEFSHPGVESKIAVDLNHSIRSTLTVSRNEWKYVAEVKTAFDEHLPLVPCLPGDFNQVMLNLIVNAAHAIGDVVRSEDVTKGVITISTRQDNEWVEIRVQDNGSGIPEKVRNKIFDPFFTTKGVGKGTGQGLAIAHSVIVDKHGGTISCETEVGKGTTFILRLPIIATVEDGHAVLAPTS